MTQLVPVVHDHTLNQLVPILPTVLAGGQLVPGAPDCAGRPSARPWRPGLCWQEVSSSLAPRVVLADRQLVPGVPGCAGRPSARPWRPGLCWQTVSSSLASRTVLADRQLVLGVPDCAGGRSARPWLSDCAGRRSARPSRPGLCWQMVSSSFSSRTVLAGGQLVPGARSITDDF
jgi:hypothetical protein